MVDNNDETGRTKHIPVNSEKGKKYMALMIKIQELMFLDGCDGNDALNIMSTLYANIGCKGRADKNQMKDVICDTIDGVYKTRERITNPSPTVHQSLGDIMDSEPYMGDDNGGH